MKSLLGKKSTVSCQAVKLPLGSGGATLKRHRRIGASENHQPNSHKLKYNKVSYFATHNVNSITSTGKLKTLTDICDREEIVIMALQELRNTDQSPIESQGYRLYKGTPGKRIMKNRVPQFGCGFLVNLKIIDSILEFKSQSPRLATLTFKSANKIYTIINAHAPTNNKNNIKAEKEEVQGFWDLLDQTIVKIPPQQVKLLVGDFNAQLGRERKYRDIVGKWPAQKRTNKNGARAIEICRNNDFISKSTCFKRLPHKLKTWKHPDHKKGEWQIDHVFMDKNFHREIQNVKVLRGTDSGSDHYIVKIKIKVTPFKKKKANNKIKRKFDPTSLINNEIYLKRTKEDIKNTKNLNDLTSKLKSIAEELAPLKPRKKHQWWNGECDLAVEKRHQAWINHQTQKTDKSHENLLCQRKMTSKIIRNTKRNFHTNTLNQIEDHFNKNKTRDYFKTFGKYLQKFDPPTLMLKNEKGEIAHNNSDNSKILASAFKNLYNCEEPTQLLQIETSKKIFSEQETGPPSLNEITQSIKELKNYKAGGEDHVFAEVWKNASENTITELHRHLMKIWEEEKLPEHWTMGVIHPLYKKGDKTNPDNYRGITLLDCTYKIFSKIILNRVKNTLEPQLGEYQGGFRPYRSCTDQILSLKLIMENFKLNNKQLLITFIDFKKAYDCIHRPTLLQILKNYGLHPKIVKIIELTLTNTHSKVKFRDEISDPFPIKTGLRQGDGLSPLLFNTALDYIIKTWQKENPVKTLIGTGKKVIKTNILGFADDLALLALNMEEVKKQIISLEKIAEKIGLKISYEKTEIMAMDPLCINKIKINDKEIKIVEQFKYLGEIIHCRLKEKQSWENRTTKIKRAQSLTWQTYKKKCLSIKSKIRHYNTVVLPEAIYAGETIFQIKNENKTDQLLKTERRIIRTCLNKSYQKDGTWRIATNETVYKQVDPILSTIKKRRISFFFHILRMPENRILKQLVIRNINKKTCGKYVGEIKKDLQEIGLRIEDAQNKNKINNVLQSSRFNIGKTERHSNVVVTDEIRKQRSDRMKKYWKDRKVRQNFKKKRNITD